jgi:hypothetical protein
MKPFLWKSRPRQRWAVRDENLDIYTAAGILFYTDSEILVQMTNRGLEPFGGKVEPTDQDIIDTACREAAEESNGVLYTNPKSGQCLSRRIQQSQRSIRNLLEKQGTMAIKFPEIKYVLFLFEISDGIYSKIRNTDVFGQTELYTRINRSVSWVKISDLVEILNGPKKTKTCLVFDKPNFHDLVMAL